MDKVELSPENVAFREAIQLELRDNPHFGIDEVREMRTLMTPEMRKNEEQWFYSHVGDWINVE